MICTHKQEKCHNFKRCKRLFCLEAQIAFPFKSLSIAYPRKRGTGQDQKVDGNALNNLKVKWQIGNQDPFINQFKQGSVIPHSTEKMVSPSHLKALQHPLQALAMKSPSSSSTIRYMKIKTLIHTFIFSHVCRLVRALAKAKSILIQILKDNIQPIHFLNPTKTTKMSKKKKKIFFGSFRLHYNWCSSHVLPVPAPVLDECSAAHLYYDSTWNSVISTEQCEDGESELSGYLHWLEEKVRDNNNNSSTTDQQKMNEIDRLADIFIANCHEKFRLEKQESYRRFQELLARSM